ncbi:calcium-binding protein [Jannaschia aquimarina]|uniref:HlyA_5 protein n=1 Tax=Jannaschia aquimarina TaxID=935700 RepID=A0A0D1ECE7_9RHOB|nr:calcium-binding protein [Jannaschia aquimarina]KIT15389.1 Hemolysin, chromosomal [Jannaschia aquimarina]SNT23012.1 Hemolysin-type calcium-binding repeat-containing protein [Jannaschia aquimarina]
MLGGTGNDTIDGDGRDIDPAEAGDDTLDGGEGIDVLRGNGGDDSLSGGAGSDGLLGGTGEDTLDGGAGDDLIDGLRAGATTTGPDGAGDVLDGGDGDDSILAGAGDVVTGGDGADLIQIGAGDVLTNGPAVIADYEDGTDIIEIAFDGDDPLAITVADEGDDAIVSIDGIRSVVVQGGAGLQAGNVRVTTEELESFADATAFERVLTGSEDDDRIEGTAGADLIDGGDGDDEINAFRGSDTVVGGAGDDDLNGQRGDDLLEGAFNATVYAGASGSSGADLIEGAAGDDTLIGGGGDTMTGGIGSDLFRVVVAEDGLATITDWNTGSRADIVEIGIPEGQDATLPVTVQMDGEDSVILYGGEAVARVAAARIDAADVLVRTVSGSAVT